MSSDIEPVSREEAARATVANLRRLAEQIERGELEALNFSDEAFILEITPESATSKTYELTGTRMIVLLLEAKNTEAKIK